VSFVRRRVVEPLRQQLRQGITPAKLALSLALGVVISIFPVLGFTAVICGLVAFALRLNQPAILLANYLAYPLQLALYIPFFKLGAWLLGAPPVSFSLSQVRAELSADLWGTMARYAVANLRAVGAWALLAPAAAALLWLLLRALLRRLPLPAEQPRV
jgi:uncharacterized protein (DUF2062 family)